MIAWIARLVAEAAWPPACDVWIPACDVWIPPCDIRIKDLQR
jgi:hypothetical protein